MDAGKIESRIILISTAVVMAVEWGMGEVMRIVNSDRLLMVGLTRCLQIGLIFFLMMVMKKSLSPLGLTKSGLGDGIKKGACWSLAFALAALMAGVVVMSMGKNPMVYLASPFPSDTKKVILLIIVGGIIGPVAEEIFFRGICYGYFRRWGVIAAVLLTTAVFVTAHAITSGIPVPQIVGGIVFAAAYEIEKNLMVPIIVHVSGNLALFLMSWLI